MAHLGYPSMDFMARHSWDYLRIEPVVLQYIEENGYPDLIVRSKVEDYVRENTNLTGITEARIPKVVSQALHLVGYDNRSAQGKTFDKAYAQGKPVVAWCIRAADTRSVPKKRWRIISDLYDSMFKPEDDHKIKRRGRYRSPPDRIIDDVASLAVFFPVY